MRIGKLIIFTFLSAILVFSSTLTLSNSQFNDFEEVDKNFDYLLPEINSGFTQEDVDNSLNSEKIIVVSSSSILPFDNLIQPIKVGENFVHIILNNSPRKVRQLALQDSTLRILPDIPIDFESFQSRKNPIQIDSFQASEILGNKKVWEEYNVTGKGVTIGITDTGIDFGVSDLSSSVVIRSDGYTANFDPTGLGVALAPLTLPPVNKQGELVLELEGLNMNIWLGEQGRLSTTDELGIQFNDLIITGITQSKSGLYKIGLAVQLGLVESIPDQYFLFVLVDSESFGVYDTIYVDFDTSLALTLVQNGEILPSGKTFIDLIDFSLTDEEPFGKNNPIPVRDFDGDGVNDISLGSLGTVIDQNIVSGTPLIKGIDENGRAIGVFYDSLGHGTLVASAAVGRGISNFSIYDDVSTEIVENSTLYQLPGSAPEAKVIATKGNSLVDFFFGWLWTAGLEFELAGNQLFLVENPENLVDISSNSWGVGIFANENKLGGKDFYSLFLDYLSIPDTIYEGYPGIIFVVAGGNGGPGFGTIARPAMASMAITVGASTYYHFLNGSRGRNDVAWFSARGPSSYGTIKPDIVAPGHSGFTLYPLSTGLGNGNRSTGIFGGTSEAAPRAAGVVALLYQAYLKRSIDPNFEDLRLVLKSTAMDLGFHPSQQGAGLINSYKAVTAIMKNDIVIGSTYASQIAAEKLQPAYEYQFGNIQHPLKNKPLLDFVTVITPEQLKTGISIEIQYTNGTLVLPDDYQLEVEQMVLEGTSRFDISTNTQEVAINIGKSLPTNWKQSDLMELSLSLTESSWNDLSSNGLQIDSLFLQDDISGNIVSDILSFSTWSQLFYSGNPGLDFKGDPLLKFQDPGFVEQISLWDGVEYQINSRVYQNQPWTNIAAIENIGIISLTGIVEHETQFGSINITVAGFSSIKMPLVISSTKVAEFGDNLKPIGSDLSKQTPLQQNSLNGYFDWGYRPESGDVRYYQIEVPANATFLVVYGKWFDEGLMPNLYMFNSSGDLLVTSDVQYIGNGFYESSSSEPFSQNLIIPVDDAQYTLLVHTSQAPFYPGPFKFDLYTRYLTFPSLPGPEPIYSQNLNFSISDSLEIDVSNYNVEQFPELEITGIDMMVFQGNNGSVTSTLDSFAFEAPVSEPLSLNSFDSIEFLNFDKGDKVNIALTWNESADLDFYVYYLDDVISFNNDRLNGLGTSIGTSFEIAKFDADESGVYLVLIDYVGGLNSTQNLNYTVYYDVRNGPILTENGSTIELDTEIFANGDFGLWMLFRTNFNLFFQIIETVSFLNHQVFDFNVNNPLENDVLRGDVTVSWEASVDNIVVDLSIQIDGITLLLSGDIVESSFNFDSNKFPNGEATLIITASNGIFSITQTLGVTLDNLNPSQLPTVQTTIDRSLPIIFSITLTSIIGLTLIRKKKLISNR